MERATYPLPTRTQTSTTDEPRQSTNSEWQKKSDWRHSKWCGDPNCALCEIAHPEANPHCKVCGGAGFVHPIKSVISGPEGDIVTPDYTRLMACRAPGCLAGVAVENRKSRVITEITRGERPQTFETFKEVDGTEKALQASKAFAEGKADFIFLMLIGGLGCGKTHLCQAVALKLVQNGQVVKLKKVSEMLGELREAISNNTTEVLIKEYQQVPALILDDYEVEHTSPWGDEEIERIVDYRYQQLLPTMLTTNANVEELDRKVGRLQSRFADRQCSLTVVNKGADFRKGRL